MYILKELEPASVPGNAPHFLNAPHTVCPHDDEQEQTDDHEHCLEGVCPHYSFDTTLQTQQRRVRTKSTAMAKFRS